MKQPNYDLYNALVNSLTVYDCEPSIKKIHHGFDCKILRVRKNTYGFS